MFQTMYQVIWQFRQDHAVSKLFCFDFNFHFDFFISSPRTSFRSLKIKHYIRLLENEEYVGGGIENVILTAYSKF